MGTRRLLVADDDRALLEAMSTRLTAEGYAVHCVVDAYQAVHAAREFAPDVMLVDLNMPAGNGFSVQERLQAIPELRELPVIYISGDESEQASVTAQELGAFALLRKPFETETLLETIRAALGEWVTATPQS